MDLLLISKCFNTLLFVPTAHRQTSVQPQQQQVLVHKVRPRRRDSAGHSGARPHYFILTSCARPPHFLRSPPHFLFSDSDDNMLKNIELFDKLGLRFNGRVLFVKDVLGDEICCWSFYGEGRKIAEVCCTSIVYATEKKQTKVKMREGAGVVC